MEADTVIRVLLARKAELSRISLRAYRKKPPCSLFICLISAIPAPENWCIGRVVMDDGSETWGMVYIMNLIRLQPPTAAYYNAIAYAYEKLGFSDQIESVLEPALERSRRRHRFRL